jgi:tRNA modification GTPase
VVRISGSSAPAIAGELLHLEKPLQPRYATFARAHGDHVIATYFPAPRSYTGEHVVEVSAHGSPVVLRQIVTQAMQAGARLAEPGEFTLRAYLNGRIDLVQAEAVADLIDSVTPIQARAAFDQLDGTLTGRITAIDAELFDVIARLEASLDFPDEGYHFVEPDEAGASIRTVEAEIAALLCDARRGRLIREGARVTIAGKPNVGKSSLFNALVRTGRAIVAPIPGTTRDLVTESVDIEGLRVELVDTAGIRETADEVESEGVSRARHAWFTSDLVMVVLDASQALDEADEDLLRASRGALRLIVANKADLPRAQQGSANAEHYDNYAEHLAKAGHADLYADTEIHVVSSTTGEGLDKLRCAIRRRLEGSTAVPRDTVAITNVRHADLLARARDALRRACDAIGSPDGPVAEEFVLTDLQDARAALEEVTGKRTSEDVLRQIFSKFCIGK